MKSKYKIIRNMGFKWTAFRAQHEIRKKTGLLKRSFKPKLISNYEFIEKHIKVEKVTDEKSLLEYFKNENSTHFFIKNTEKISDSLNNLLSKEEKKKVIKSADEILKNKFTYFSKSKYEYENISWHYSPFTNAYASKEKHWVDISDLNNDFGDIKFIWEISRFSFVYDLVRAYALTENDDYVKKYWELIEDWIENNPNEHGVNYIDSQEMSLRVMSWIFGLFAFLSHQESTPTRVTELLKIINIHLKHINKNFNFALKSIQNNHSITEAAGMYTVGILFPFLEGSKNLKNKGKHFLEKEASWQIYKDGSYIQNSMNYNRLMLQDYTWVLQLASLNNDSFSNKMLEKLKKSVMFLYENQIESNGRLPNYGMNDGALIHPLSVNDYLDYRPQLNAAWVILTGERLYPKGNYDENLLWLFGGNVPKYKKSNVKRSSKEFINGGYYTFRNNNTFGMIRCTTFKHRPAQADMLHFDLWIEGVNVLTDGGTYSYNTDKEYTAYFNGTSSHNTVMIDQKDQMQKGNRFIWLDWTKSRVLKYKTKDNYTVFEGEHYGYSPLIHRRGILNIHDSWIIVDDVFGEFNGQPRDIQLSWLFGVDEVKNFSYNTWKVSMEKDNYEIKIYSPTNTRKHLYYGNKDPFKGWQSLYYGEMIKRPQLILSNRDDKNMRFITVIKKEEINIILKEDNIILDNQEIKLSPIGSENIFINIKDEK